MGVAERVGGSGSAHINDGLNLGITHRTFENAVAALGKLGYKRRLYPEMTLRASQEGCSALRYIIAGVIEKGVLSIPLSSEYRQSTMDFNERCSLA